MNTMTASDSKPEDQEMQAAFDQWWDERMKAWRPTAWEDDISRNSLDNAPFENLPPICERLEEVEKWKSRAPKRMQEEWDIVEMARNDTAPIPCPRDREGYSPGQDAQYWVVGLTDYWKILKTAERNDVDIQSYFDFGCASGRVIRHFAAQRETPVIWGSDINARHIRWLCNYMPKNVRPVANHCIPTIPIPDNSVDCVSAFSVFTHIDTFETCWIAEMARVLRPGGMAYLTVHNEATWEMIAKEVDNPNNRLVQSITNTDPTVREKLQHPMPAGRTVFRFTDVGPYRAQVFHSNDYLHQVWGRFMDICEILDCFHVRQSVVVMKKPSR